jgi:hypothetical protein
MTRGGKRKGAGRPPGRPDELYRRVTLTLSPDALALIDAYALEHKMSRSAALERLALAGLKKL